MKIIICITCFFIAGHTAYCQSAKKDTVVIFVSKTKPKPAAKPKPKPKPKVAETAKPVEPPKPVVIPVPEFINQPYYYDSSDNRLIKLENSTAALKTKKKTLGLKGAKDILTMEYSSAKVRFTSRNNISFLIKTGGDVIDLTSYIKLYRFTVNEEKREAMIASKEGIISNKEDEKGKLISFGVKMIAPDNYMIQFAEPLQAGEYGFVWVKNMELKEFTVYAFGIDWKSSD
jgi:hypothetical protein